jgi:uncharacterized membrane protein
MRRKDLMKPDPLSNIVLLSSGIVLLAALATLMVLQLRMPHQRSLQRCHRRLTAFCRYAVSQTRRITGGIFDGLDIAG